MNIPRDKLLHAGMGAAAAVAGICLALLNGYVGLALTGLASAVMVGLACELVQKVRGEGTPEIADTMATAAGGFIVAVAVAVLTL